MQSRITSPDPAWRTAVDALLELSIVGSFSRLGPAIRRRLDGWTDPPLGSLAGRTVLITGPTSGLGRMTAFALADLGARVVLVGRNPDKLGDVAAELTTRTGEDRFPTVVADIGSLASVRAAAAEVLAGEERLDVLIDNAGAIYPERVVGPDGMEATFGLMVGGPFALTTGLLPLLRASGGQVIAVTSGGMYSQALDLADLQSSRGEWSGPKAYARAKRAQTALIREWARRFAGTGLTFNAMHPGWADTPGLADSLPAFHRFMGPLLRSPEDGADTIVWLAAHPESEGLTGQFDRAPQMRLSAADRRALWDALLELTGTEDPTPVDRPRPSR